MIVVVDYGMGNLGSILNMLRKVGAQAKASAAPADIRSAEKIVLPGVGAYDHGMRQLASLGLKSVLTERVVEQGVPLLGICLGAQLLTAGSDEGNLGGLGWIPGRTVRFTPDVAPGLKVPHMGWNAVHPRRSGGLFAGLESGSRFYFVHSFYLQCDFQEDVLATTVYGLEFASAIQRGRIAGVQFHPEKSHKFGMSMMKNFIETP